MAAPRDVSELVQELVAEGRLRWHSGYGKADLLKSFSLKADVRVAEDCFAQLRASVTTGLLGPGVYVGTTGVRRGLKYVFSRESEPPGAVVSPSTPPTRRLVAPHATARAGASTTDIPGSVQIFFGDNLPHLREMPDQEFRLIYIDPPFNTGRQQARTQISTVRDDENGDRTGFKGNRYRTTVLGRKSFDDSFDDYLEFLAPRLEEAHRLLALNGSLFLHLDYREVHYAKVLLDQIFGRDCFMNEIIWAYDYGARSTKRWSAKHDNILWYARSPENYVFNFDEMERIPYMAPGLVGPEKAARGKTPTDVWWHTIVSPNGSEKTGYPTQKPLGVIRWIVKVHSSPADKLLDFFAGSGTLGEAGAEIGRHVTLVDNNPEALSVMQKRLSRFNMRVEQQDAAALLGLTKESPDLGVGTSRADIEPVATTRKQTDLFT